MKAQLEFDSNSPEYYGFGIGIMKMIKVCGQCGASEPSSRYVCSHCGARLTDGTLFQVYQRMHELCPVCHTVLTRRMKFCPHCGVQRIQNNLPEDEES